MASVGRRNPTDRATIRVILAAGQDGTPVMRLLIAALAMAGLAAGTPARATEPIEITQGETKLHATLFRPSGSGPFPAVVAMHDCDGLAARSSLIAPWYRDWGERLAASGFAVVFPDSFTSRGVAPQCHVLPGTRLVRASHERILDANAAR